MEENQPQIAVQDKRILKGIAKRDKREWNSLKMAGSVNPNTGEKGLWISAVGLYNSIENAPSLPVIIEFDKYP